MGGPAMLRAAAKNHAAVAVVVDSADYARVLAEMQAHNGAISDVPALPNSRPRLSPTRLPTTAPSPIT